MATQLRRSDRHQRILAALRIYPTARASELAERFQVTSETIRRDLEELAERGLVYRTYGGVVALSKAYEPGVSERERTMVSERGRIGEKAAGLIQAGEVVMIDSGSTTMHFARRLAERAVPLTVLTNRPAIAEVLSADQNVRVILCPGNFSKAEDCAYGPETLAFLKRFNATSAVIGAGGLTRAGLTDVDSEAAWIKRAMIERAERTIAVVDHLKYNLALLEVVCPLQSVSILVSDAPPDDELAEVLQQAGVHLHLAI
ncbi:MAG: DeoR/GlpR transcriptional regulator [Parvularculaceae bacterium]|nr:DeoR/GlpR transcriptional regulator [Parvularculaceae bacterium]